ncbi:MAG: tryptophan--tRNA ligase [Gemmatimonadetes bacterium]|nr:tryptophan--tRNA ligase [Gemmatimonadota bacterium]
MSGQQVNTGKRRILSGVQPSGEAHLGNYLGAFRQWVDLQDTYDCLFCIVDQHAITGQYDPALLPQRIFDMAVSLLAVGLDPDRCSIFVQSEVQEHTELAWLFNAVTPVGELERMTQYKDKSSRLESIPAGLLNYPILQAADILIYRAQAVPVGEDQLQHLELTREIARKWNAQYGELFPEPQAIVGGTGRIMGLDGEAKMSKSLGNTVGILAEPEEVWSQVRTAVTDPQRIRKDDPGRPEVCNVYSLHEFFTDSSDLPDIAEQCRTAQRGCVDCKKILAENVAHEFEPFRDRAAHYRDRPEEVMEVLATGARQATVLAQETMAEVRRKMGMDWRKALT